MRKKATAAVDNVIAKYVKAIVRCKGEGVVGDKRLPAVAGIIAGKHNADLFSLVHSAEVHVSKEEVEEALAEYAAREKATPAFEKVELPEEYLPTGSGQLLQRTWRWSTR